MPLSLVNRIREHRKRRGWTQEELGQRVGVSKQRVSQYERGERRPTVEMVYRLAEALGVSTNDVYRVENGETGIEP